MLPLGRMMNDCWFAPLIPVLSRLTFTVPSLESVNSAGSPSSPPMLIGPKAKPPGETDRTGAGSPVWNFIVSGSPVLPAVSVARTSKV